MLDAIRGTDEGRDSPAVERGVDGIVARPRDVDAVVPAALVEEREQEEERVVLVPVGLVRRELGVGALVVMEREADLFQVVLALRFRAASRACCTAGRRIATSTATLAEISVMV